MRRSIFDRLSGMLRGLRWEKGDLTTPESIIFVSLIGMQTFNAIQRHLPKGWPAGTSKEAATNGQATATDK